MPKLRVLSGKDIIAIFALFGFAQKSQRGSHVKLLRIKGTESQILTIPLHKELDRGTVKGIYNQALRYLQEDQLQHHFYTS